MSDNHEQRNFVERYQAFLGGLATIMAAGIAFAGVVVSAKMLSASALAQRQFEVRKPFLEGQARLYSEMLRLTTYFIIEPIEGEPTKEKRDEWDKNLAKLPTIYSAIITVVPKDEEVRNDAANFKHRLDEKITEYNKECNNPAPDCQAKALKPRKELADLHIRLRKSVAEAIQELMRVP